MRRRLLGLVVSITLAAVGTLVLVGYVQGAHDTAAAGEPMATVLVVSKPIPKGTKASDLEGRVRRAEVPEGSKVDGAVEDVGELEGKVAAADLLPGEQVLAARFQTPQALGREGVPKGMLEVTVRLSSERALGGAVRTGDTVAVLSSFAPFDIDVAGVGQGAAADSPKKTPNTTHVILHKVLVTNVQTTGDVKKDEKPADAAAGSKPVAAPKGEFLVTLALDATSVQRVVFTAEFGTLWLSAEPSDAPDGQTRVETRGTVD